MHANGAVMAEQRIGLLGGTFDPIHMGHLLLAVHSYEELDLDRVIFIPARMPPHKGQPAVSAEQRLEMVRLAVSNDDRFLVCDCELSRTSPSYTIDTVKELQESLGSETELFWLIGSDMLEDLPSWREANKLVDIINIVVVQRVGQPAADFSALQLSLTVEQINRIQGHAFNVSLIDISSTMVRERIAQGLSLRYFLPESVEKYISENKLYRR
jgi:nicotinate-nucleotide adenylyltransferase